MILSKNIEEQIIAAANLTISDELVLEKFVMWNDVEPATKESAN